MSFYYAVCGFLGAIRSEAHLRFHIMIAVLISIFAHFYGISRTEWAVLILTIGAVIGAELFNTALEQAVNTATDEIKPSAKFAKDASAGAVLMLAVISVFVGIFLFGNTERILDTLKYIFTTKSILLPCLSVGFILLGFVIFGGKNGKKV
ncbi:MAG: diacylglycerol kinase family protein [Firmicutes bacterium]|nr:diacylglycerol kinase family protein [Bacillota bacterium]